METNTDVPRAGAPLQRWARGTVVDHARFTVMAARLRHAHWAGLTVGASTVLVAFWTGPAVLLTVLVAHVVITTGRWVHGRHPGAPELISVAVFALLQVDLGAAVALTGGALSPLLPLMLVPVFTQAVCLRPAVLLAGVVLSALLAAAASVVAVLGGPAPEVPAGVHLAAHAGLLATLAVAAVWMVSADRDSRGDAAHDPLTGLLNRTSLADRFALARQATGDSDLSVIMCDLDHFKAVNDTYGHPRGDLVLKEVAARLSAAVRSGDDVFRVGGEEFVVLLPGAGPDVALTVAERLREAVGRTPVAGLPITLSVGVSSHVDDLDAMTRAADHALYAAKHAGRDCVRVSTG